MTMLAFVIVQSEMFAQFADIRGKVTDGTESIGVAYIRLKKGEAVVEKVNVSVEGDFIFSDLTSGEYSLTISAMSYETQVVNVYLQPGQSVVRMIKLLPSGQKSATLKGVVIGGVRIDEDPPGTGKELKKSPYEGIAGFIKGNTNIKNRDGQLSSGSARQGQLAVLDNGTIQIGPIRPTTLGLGQVKVLASGAPAMYGDFVGGAIEYTNFDHLDTLSIRNILFRTSSPFDAFHHNTIETYLYKPLKVVEGKTKLAFTNSLFANYKNDPNPTSVNLYKLSEDTYSKLLENPILGSGGTDVVATPTQYTLENFESVKRRQNVASTNLFASLGLAWKPSDDVILRITPSAQYTKANRFSFSNSLLNSEHNPMNTSVTGKLNAQLIHTLKRPYNSKGELTYDSSLFSKINYMITADYQRFNSQTKDPIHQDNIFGYGHIGKFETAGNEIYTYVDEVKTLKDQYDNDVVLQGYYKWDGHEDTDVSFTGNEDYQVRSSITQFAIDNNDARTLGDVSQFQGLLNGQNPNSINGMWYAPGTVLSNYSKSDQQKASVSAILNMSLNPDRKIGRQHDLQVGLLFEQRKRSYYSLNANTLWQLMPLLLNFQYSKESLSSPILSYDEDGVFMDTVSYLYNADLNRQSVFDKNLRNIVGEENGYTSGGAHFVDINSIDPSKLSLDMFSADELWNNGSSYVNYAGYDHTGKLVRGNKSVNDFINDKANRYVNAHNPNYTAIWFQDKFVLEKIKIRAGVRVERFDANQLVLKDPYSLYAVKTIGEVPRIGEQAIDHPSTLSSEAAVYVNDMHSPSAVLGYREGSTWYDENGVQLASAEYLRRETNGGVIQPFLVDPSNQKLGAESFKDFSPEVLVLPRLSLSFPISSKALFYAYYDKFAQRPSFSQSFAPINTYYFLENASSTLLPNPALKPSKRTDYQIGYKQQVGDRGVLNVTAGYADIRDDINLISVEQAYPRTYTTYGNVDFSTVKKFGADYRIKLSNMAFTANYLLQFADGTGSNANSAAALIQVGQPNLKSLYPLEYDVRHKLNFSANFALDSLSRKKKSIFKNMRVNLFANTQSGTPYTALVNAIPEAQNLGTVSRSQIKGNPFGSRLPWNCTMDMSISKAAIIKNQPIIFQLNILNLLNLINLYGVYAATSSATDDGYLSSPKGQQEIAREQNAQAFVEYYNLKQNNPIHFGAPRTISLTVRTTF